MGRNQPANPSVVMSRRRKEAFGVMWRLYSAILAPHPRMEKAGFAPKRPRHAFAMARSIGMPQRETKLRRC
jgi:hypothetical protein